MNFIVNVNTTETTFTSHWITFYGAETKRRVS